MVDIQDLTAGFNSLYQNGRFLEAAEYCDSLVAEYEEKDDRLMAAETRNNQSVAYLRGGQARKALAAALGTEAVFADAGDPRRQAIALGNQAAAFEALGNLEEAAGLYRRSADLLEKGGDREYYSMVMNALSSIYLRQGKQMDTLTALQASLQDDQKLTGRQKFLKKLLKGLLPFLR